MGQSTPTTTMAFETFQQRYANFRAELHPRDHTWFDLLLEGARRRSNAINRRPHLDFERPVMLAMMMQCMQELSETRDEVESLRLQLREACKAMEQHGVMERRLRHRFVDLSMTGQVQLAA